MTEKPKVTPSQFDAWLAGQRDCANGISERSSQSPDPDYYRRGYSSRREYEQVMEGMK